MKEKVFRFFIAAFILAALLSGCGSDTGKQEEVESSKKTQETAENKKSKKSKKEEKSKKSKKEEKSKKSEKPKNTEETKERQEQDPGASVIPPYEIKQTFYEEMHADDGVLIWRDELFQPVFSGGSKAAKKMNAVFEKDIPDTLSLDDPSLILDMYYTGQGSVYEETNNGRVGGFRIEWKESFRHQNYISFVSYEEYDGLGTHGTLQRSGYTFDCASGDLLKLSDVLSLHSDQLTERIYQEYIAYHAALGDGFDMLAQGIYEGGYDEYWADSVRKQCGEDAVFWLADDGLHIYFHQYTFFYAIGESELVIPYERSDLLRPEFASSPSSSSPAP